MAYCDFCGSYLLKGTYPCEWCGYHLRSYSHYRSTHCWSCKHPITSDDSKECSFCGWLICYVCGACSESAGKCLGVLRDDTETWDYVRKYHKSVPDESFGDVAKKAIDFHRIKKEEEERRLHAEEQKKLRQIEEARKREYMAYVSSLKQRLLSRDRIRSKFGSLGAYREGSYISSGPYMYFEVDFEKQKGVRFQFPNSFIDGYLSFEQKKGET